MKPTEAHSAKYFEGKENPLFGPMTAKEWSNQFYKHIDHHFTQFGVQTFQNINKKPVSNDTGF